MRQETIERLKNLYGKPYFESEELMRKRERMQEIEFAHLRKYFDLSAGGNVLDIGCGTGNFLAKFPPNWKKFGIELSDFARAEAEKRGVITEMDMMDDFFDLIIFRGTIQHLPDPIAKIGECFYWLKRGGGIVFLATPNINSIYYKLFNDLPMIAKEYNFLLPSDLILEQILTNFGFEILGFEYPYRETPYAKPTKDLFAFFLKLLRIKKDIRFAFPRNLLECYARKP
ncbi:MAG: class I SAM-dependent methyltransferase [Candidatus Peribacteraceae bacterium]|nr:class I SAM-dependent methyltransferase [Candidatus Peribacteraceae bacterium]